MGLFKRKKETPSTTIKSDEYTQLLSMIEKLRIRFESLELELDLYKKKLRTSKGLEREEDKKNDKNLNSQLLPEQ
jgi:hypothetical protein